MERKRRRSRAWLAWSLCAAGWILANGPGWAGADPSRVIRDIKELASPEMKGRGDGTPELDRAASFIVAEFRAAGLTPLDGKSFFQPFAITTGATLGPNCTLQAETAAGEERLQVKEDFLPLSFSSSGQASGKVVFAGYGITAPEYGYDDYTHLDVRGKIVLVLRHEPQEHDPHSVFLGTDFTRHAEFINKAINARNHGAIALVLVNDRAAHPKEEDLLVRFGSTMGPEDVGIPVIQVKAAMADRWLTPGGKTLERLQAAIDRTLQPQSQALPDTLSLRIRADVERHHATVNNVAGFLPGASSQYLIIGAHYDHLGLGEQFSLAPSQAGQVHPGADDNASGTAGLIELAHLFAAEPRRNRGVVFLAFAGEELGLLGSMFYAEHPVLPLAGAAAMINMDMIGRIRNSKVYVGGVGTGTTFRPLLEQAGKDFQFQLEFSDGGYDASDHTSFTAKQVPVLFFFSGLHGDYHKPSDTWDKIDGPGTARLIDLIFEVADQLDHDAARPEFVRVKDAPPAGAATGSVGGGYGPYFGSIPDFGENQNGVKFADVRDGSPAAKAGLKAGDVLTEFDGKPIRNLYDFTYALRSKSVGDRVRVRILRNDKPLDAVVTLEQRR